LQNALARTRVQFLFQKLQFTDYKLQGDSKRLDRFQVLVKLNNLRITKLKTLSAGKRLSFSFYVLQVKNDKLQVFYVCTLKHGILAACIQARAKFYVTHGNGFRNTFLQFTDSS
jgi:hypothetical protein